MALLYRKKLLLAKSETTYGTDPTPSASTNAILTSNLTITPLQADSVDRNYDRATLGNAPSVLVGQRVVITFDVELAGSGTPGTEPGWSPLIKACGFGALATTSTSVVYKPAESPNVVSVGAPSSVTLYYHMDGIAHKIVGCRGTVSFTLNAGEVPKMTYTMTGQYAAPVSTTLPTADMDAFAAPLAVNKVNTPTARLGTDYTGDQIVLQSFSVDIGNDVQHRNLVNSDQILIVDRAPTSSITFEAVPLSTRDYITYSRSSTDLQFRIQHGTSAADSGNVVKIDMPKVQFNDASYTESNGILMLSGTLKPLPTDAGNDEIEITLS